LARRKQIGPEDHKKSNFDKSKCLGIKMALWIYQTCGKCHGSNKKCNWDKKDTKDSCTTATLSAGALKISLAKLKKMF